MRKLILWSAFIASIATTTLSALDTSKKLAEIQNDKPTQDEIWESQNDFKKIIFKAKSSFHQIPEEKTVEYRKLASSMEKLNDETKLHLLVAGNHIKSGSTSKAKAEYDLIIKKGKETTDIMANMLKAIKNFGLDKEGERAMLRFINEILNINKDLVKGYEIFSQKRLSQ